MASNKLAVMLVGAGRLGSHIADELLKRGDRVTIMVRDPSKIAELEKRGATLIKGDICKDSQDTLTKHVKGIDVVISAVQGGPETIIEA